MKTSDIVEIVKSPAFTILVGTLCLVYIVREIKPVIEGFKN